MKNPHQIGLSISIALLLSACGCGGGGSSTTVSTNNTGTTTTPSTTANKPALKQAANNAELETLIKQQMLEMYGTVRSDMYPCGKGSDMCIMPVMATASPSAVADTAKSVSSTNTQETNVDEADRIKTDGTTSTPRQPTSPMCAFSKPMAQATRW
ncbi:MAG: hypothetical protein BWK73_51590 [Thiothrix lacustris]|uniref:Uncharacterized protein n=1 Tax=Thiothrix lacustris TaxID=525917 RepID=A0A1Y1Q7V8_9GAMM|nr:MAG: hypothetical protein BWK73_51590 [Thiothrix lacustris]